MIINKKINHKVIWFDSIMGMTWGFLGTLVAGTIVGLLAINQTNTFSNLINSVKGILTFLTPFGIGAGVAIKAKLKPLQIIATIIAGGLVGHSLLMPIFSGGNILWNANVGFRAITNVNSILKASPGDVFGAWIGSTLIVYFFTIFSWNTLLDVIIVPIIGAILGITLAMFITYLSSTVTVVLKWVIHNSANKYHWAGILLAPVIGIIMGLALSMPTSSAAIAFAVNLQGDAATAAMAATAAQMISFGIMTYMSTKKIGISLAVGFGSSMLQMGNFIKKPKLLIIPSFISGFTALLAVAIIPLEFAPQSVTSGMGTCALYGQIFTMQENGWTNYKAWLNMGLMQLIIPALLTIGIFAFVQKKKWIMPEELTIKEHHE